jgi:hypothetical protein
MDQDHHSAVSDISGVRQFGRKSPTSGHDPIVSLSCAIVSNWDESSVRCDRREEEKRDIVAEHHTWN